MKRILTWTLLFIFSGLNLLGQLKQITIHFDSGRWKVHDTSITQLKEALSQHLYQSALVEGHCDSVGSVAYNQSLSEKRAKAVSDLLIENGLVKEEILNLKGYGKRHPLNKNKTEWDRFMNRRVIVQLYESPLDSVKKYALRELKYEEMKTGENFMLENILFEPARHYLKEESYRDLEKVWELLMDHPTMEIEIQGHVCCTTDEPDGFDQDTGIQNLSEARAQAVMEYLIQNGIEDYRLSIKGFGGTRKINSDEETELKRRVNRRVEFKVIRK